MGKRIKQSIVFLLLLLVVVCLIQYGIDYCYRARVTNKFTKLLKHQTDPGVMIFGSSVVYHQFNPSIIADSIGMPAYNMGWPGMFFAQYGGLIREYLSYTKNCKCIVIGCDFDNLGKTDLIRNPDLFYAYLCNKNVYNSLHGLEPKKILLAKYIPGYKLTLLGKAFYTDMLFARRNNDTLSGFEPLDNQWEQTRALKPFDTRYDEQVYIQFGQTVDEITAKGIKVVLVIPPVYTQGYGLMQNAAMIKSKYQALVKKNVYFLDYTTDSMCSRREYFHNFTHLNSMGAAIFSHTFAHDLLKILHE